MEALRGFGKTRSAAEWIVEQAATKPNTRWAIIAPTWGECAKVCIEGPSGVLSALLEGELLVVNHSDLTVHLTNGSKIHGYSSDRPDRLIGMKFDGVWMEEIGAMPNVTDVWDGYVCRALNEKARAFITTAPSAELSGLHYELLNDDTGRVAKVSGSTWNNAENLSPAALAALKERYGNFPCE